MHCCSGLRSNDTPHDQRGMNGGNVLKSAYFIARCLQYVRWETYTGMQFYIDFQIIIDYPVLGLTDIYISDHIRYLDL